MKFQIKTFLILLYFNCYVKFAIQKPTQRYWYETRPGYKWAFAHSYSWAVIPKDGVSNGNAHSSGISMTGTQDGVHSSQQPMNNYPINGQQNVPLYGMDGQNQQQYQQQGQHLNELQLKAYIQNLLQQQQLRSQSQLQSTQSQFPNSQPLSVPTYQSPLTQPQTQSQLQIPLSMPPPQIPFSSQLPVSHPQLPQLPLTISQPQSLSPQPQPFAQPHSLPQSQALPLTYPQYLPQPQPLPLSKPQTLPFPQPQSLPFQPQSLPLPQPQSLPFQPQSLPLPQPQSLPFQPQSLPLHVPQSLPLPQPQSLPVPQPQSIPLPQPQSADLTDTHLENYIRKIILDMQSQSTTNNDAVNVPKYNNQNLIGSNSNLQNQRLTDEQLQRIINKILTGSNYDSSTNSVQNQNSDLQHQSRAQQQHQQPQNVPVNYYQQPLSSNYNDNPYTSPVSNTGLNQQYPILGKQPTTTIDCSNCPLASSGPIAIASSISLANLSPQHLITDPLKLLGASSMTYTRV